MDIVFLMRSSASFQSAFTYSFFCPRIQPSTHYISHLFKFLTGMRVFQTSPFFDELDSFDGYWFRYFVQSPSFETCSAFCWESRWDSGFGERAHRGMPLPSHLVSITHPLLMWILTACLSEQCVCFLCSELFFSPCCVLWRIFHVYPHLRGRKLSSTSLSS